MLRSFASNLWVVEAPLRWPAAVEIGRRMAVVRVSDGDLLLHSPAPLTDDLRGELDALGEVRWLVAASSLHGHISMGDYGAAYPRAALWGTPKLPERRRDLSFDGILDEAAAPPWRGQLEHLHLGGHRVLDEVEFFHPLSGTLISGDLCFHIGPRSPLMTRLLISGPTLKPRLGPTPLFRLGIRDRAAFGASIERILRWDFDRLLPGHGEAIDAGAHERFARAFGRWSSA